MKRTQQTFGLALARLALIVIFLWFGAMKFLPYEAEGVAGIAGSYPLLSWLYPLVGVRGASAAIGTVELLTAVMLAIGYRYAWASVVGGLMGMATFAVTLSFMATAPGVFAEGYGPPWLGSTGQFLVKDLVLLAVSAMILLNGLTDLRTPVRRHA